MELTELEFEDLLSSAMKDESNVPTEINDKLKKKLNAKSRYKRIIKSVPASAAACLVIGVVLISVIYNNQEIYEFKGEEENQLQNQGVVIETAEENGSGMITYTKEIAEEKNVKTKDVYTQEKTDIKSVEQIKTKETVVAEDMAQDTAQIEAYSGEETQEKTDDTADKTEEASQTFSRAMPKGTELSLIGYLENNQELIDDVSEKIKEKMSTDEYIEYYENFTSITGNENYYLTEENELVIIFEPGIVASAENGEIYINVGVIDKTKDESEELK